MRIQRYTTEEQLEAANSIQIGVMDDLYDMIYENNGASILLEDGKAVGVVFEDED